MAESLAAGGKPLSGSPGPSTGEPDAAARGAIDRLSSFRVYYAAIFAFVVLSVITIEVAEALLDAHFRREVAEAVRVSPNEGAIVPQIQTRVADVVQNSPWARIGGVRVDVFVLAVDGRTPLYFGGRSVPPPLAGGIGSTMADALRLLPASAEVVVSVPLDSLLAGGILVGYGAILLQGLFLYGRATARREAALFAAAVAARDTSAKRADEIESELDRVRQRLDATEPAEKAQAEAIRDLQREREALQHKLADLAEREGELRASAARSLELEQERQALEELLDEAMEDVASKDSEIHGLQDRLKRASKGGAGSGKASGRARGAELLARRLRTLYKNLEIDDRAIQDLVALRDETMKLKAEEALKRLSDESESATVRRKVGGLPPQLAIYELGFAGKGRIYYRRGRTRRYQILSVGAKNSQKTDLEYLSRLPAE